MNQAFYTIKKFLRKKMKINSKIRDIDGNLILNNDKIAKSWKTVSLSPILGRRSNKSK